MKSSVKFKLNTIKSVAIEIINSQNYDEIDLSELDYIVSTLDYLILGDIPCEVSVIKSLMESIIVTSIYQNNPKLLKVTGLLTDLLESLKDDTKI